MPDEESSRLKQPVPNYIQSDSALITEPSDKPWKEMIDEKIEGYKSRAGKELYKIPMFMLSDLLKIALDKVTSLGQEFIQYFYRAGKFIAVFDLFEQSLKLAYSIFFTLAYILPLTAAVAFSVYTGFGQDFAEKCMLRIRDIAINDIRISSVAALATSLSAAIIKIAGITSFSNVVNIIFPPVRIITIAASIIATTWADKVNEGIVALRNNLDEWGIWNKPATSNEVPGVSIMSTNSAIGAVLSDDVELYDPDTGRVITDTEATVAALKKNYEETPQQKAAREFNEERIAVTAASLMGLTAAAVFTAGATPVLLTASAISGVCGSELYKNSGQLFTPGKNAAAANDKTLGELAGTTHAVSGSVLVTVKLPSLEF